MSRTAGAVGVPPASCDASDLYPDFKEHSMRGIKNPRRDLCAAAAALAAAGTLAACGSDHSSAGHSGMAMQKTMTQANAVDKAFVRQMIPHHEGAVEMAVMAAKSAHHAEIKATLAPAIIKAQKAEIATLKSIATQLGVEMSGSEDHSMSGHMSSDSADDAAMGADAKTLGLATDAMGMSMSMTDLEDAKPFDRAFIDAMVPHHQGAIRMARAELANGTNADLKNLARAIVSAQVKEITEMNSWRTAWYGSASPAGGVPAS